MKHALDLSSQVKKEQYSLFVNNERDIDVIRDVRDRSCSRFSLRQKFYLCRTESVI